MQLEYLNLISQAKVIAEKQFKANPFSFETIWKEVVKHFKISKQDEPSLIGRFYQDFLEDPNFVYLGDRKWKLRDFMKFDEWNKISQSMFVTKEIFEEGYEDLSNKKVEPEEGVGDFIMGNDGDDNETGSEIVQGLINDSFSEENQ
ncbi:DNA-directed RNA polymerase subunit delta [Mycoplasmoides genitalium]|uniref:Probable DNA-directed RNA polymerase subunit delta n=2 Tax=Mycoplasmoides genitalium TaxID=2097 RepID=RPOE_MYCGE|nr:DNA-directed RNA polymerase subunit delta [Mycoplasmoides genitalium]P47268.1 RecName: Full=Probable DNA-directed RNA polymerase subunit delta; AltName: Full=RNAP delta factor [Mycoplasmoides genitalium G37]ABY79303.1 DNA-directed RNA polymerase, delta subunit [synthetic Mycoplasma genitalium JCVI-1.0]AAC71238.1 DNA-directed RNA polymerase, delta subunit [Mycoplasmoides genitalium G37]AFQ02831.1 DNA-directed RNA polymerase subunit delta [Mycoplasmoides genitalium M2321]AFQ03327.1 DNA-direct